MLSYLLKNTFKSTSTIFKSSISQPNQNVTPGFISTDVHSHLLPGIDDGSKNLSESIELVKILASLGYKKLITTPHIMGDFYRNTPEVIQERLEELRAALVQQDIPIEIEAAAEYYLDEYFMDLLHNNKPLLNFGNQYVLFETSFINKPEQFLEAIFLMQSLGYKPVLAHPERYVYLRKSSALLQTIVERGVHLQINLNSLAGYYSKSAQEFSEELIQKNLVSFVGTDCHKLSHLEVLSNVIKRKNYLKLASIPILNNTL